MAGDALAPHELVDRLVSALPVKGCLAVDGVDASGKTTLARAIADRHPALVASVDGFHRPRAERYARGRRSAEGCYRDTFDLGALGLLVARFRRGEPVASQVFDHVRDEPAVVEVDPSPYSFLVVEGVFLLRPELAPLWDVAVHLVLDDEEVVRRAVARDGADPELYRERYLPAQRLYEAESSPRDQADVVMRPEGGRYLLVTSRLGGSVPF